MKNNGKDVYFVAVKVFLRNKRGELFISKDRFGNWDLPGGRLKPNEFSTPLKKVVARKMKEELGSKVRYRLGPPVVFMRHQRKEFLPDRKRELRRIFAIGYEAQYLSGPMQAGKNHVKMLWVNPKKFKPEKYFRGGWLKGVREYLKLRTSTNE